MPEFPGASQEAASEDSVGPALSALPPRLWDIPNRKPRAGCALPQARALPVEVDLEEEKAPAPSYP